LNVTISSNSFFGGKRLTATLSLQPIAIIDAEPDPNNTVGFGLAKASTLQEAGLPCNWCGWNCNK
jgi:hypothetical protein